MVPPVLKCIAKEQREKDGYKSFKAWIEDPKNIYIGPHIHKYVQNYKGKESMWMNPYQAHFPKTEANTLFENFIKGNDVLLQAIPSLANKVLGCWCEPVYDSNGEVTRGIRRCHGMTRKVSSPNLTSLRTKIGYFSGHLRVKSLNE